MTTTTLPARRIQRRRTAGWRAPHGSIYVGRGSRWGNPYRIGTAAIAVAREQSWHLWRLGGLSRFTDDHILTASDAVDCFTRYAHAAVGASGFALSVDARIDLAGHDLTCWCPEGTPCHGDVLLDIAAGRAW